MRQMKLLPLLAVMVLASSVDEGQWMPFQLRAKDWNALKARGMQMTKDEFWHPEDGGVLNAAVQIGGCTASFVSPKGLIVTNHHCGYGAVNELSTLEKNYLKEGFVAKRLARELSTNMQVAVVRRIEDVTQRIHAMQAKAKSPIERYNLTQYEISKIVTEGQKDPVSGRRDPMTSCSVASFFEGREYHLYYRTQITDVRLVYAPPSSTAAFGGETDNWEWPRHSGDFSFFRAYVAPDGTPRSYHEDNVPYEPEHYLRISPKGVQEGDLVLIIGYPGQTERYLSSIAVQDREAVLYPKRHEVLSQILKVLGDVTGKDASLALELSSQIRSLANVQKNALGMVRGFARNAVVDRKLQEEEQFIRWVRRTNEHQRLYGSALEDLKEIDHDERSTLEKDTVLRFLLTRMTGQFTPILDSVMAIARQAQTTEDGREPGYPQALLDGIASPDVTKNLETIQKPVLAILLEEVRNLPGDQALTGSEALPDSDITADEMIEWISKETRMFDSQARLALLKAGRAAVEASTDPLVVFARGLLKERSDFISRLRMRAGRRLAVGPRWIEAQQTWRGKSFYPDANSTLRVSLADVKGYYPRDGVYYPPHTTVAGILEKDTGEEPFLVEDRLLNASRFRKTSRHMNDRLNDVPVCFLADGDTTGGNSGSPVINGKGELVGVNFDRVFENVAGDYGWNPDHSRNISVDIRFILWHLESVMEAPRLLKEMGL